MSCLIDPRYSTLSDATQSGPVWLAAASDALDRDTRAATTVARVRMATQRDEPACACGASRDPGAAKATTFARMSMDVGRGARSRKPQPPPQSGQAGWHATVGGQP